MVADRAASWTHLDILLAHGLVVLVAMIKHHDYEQLRDKRFYFIVCVQVSVHQGGKPARTQGRNLEEELKCFIDEHYAMTYYFNRKHLLGSCARR